MQPSYLDNNFTNETPFNELEGELMKLIDCY